MSTLDAMYQQLILEHAKARSGSDLTPDEATAMPDQAGVGQCHQLNPVCGDEITLRLELEAAGNPPSVKGIRWHGDGCAISMASASILSELSEGASPDELSEMIDHFRELMRSRGRLEPDEEILGDAAALAGVAKYPARVKCAMLAWVAAEDALRQAVATSR
ncbi:nitrogen fixation protein NifU [Arthrobacter sp. SPG23]|uniref:Fe-S cluster assembly sulfur transfer protein SufU n=1 Tax=Arthrobacter sp. SPG23 TaxID=1610703 RepID=UPI0005BD467E|nr:SUF system NifU family Fe-S cluster assembly protein [Arthrobacter sp. SPG23]KIS28308.1 nitrogen fixation protein NifU [Arthrobacter sp. SPG23]